MAAARKRSARSTGKPGAAPRALSKRTPLAEWIAAGLGLSLTLGVLSFSLWEAATDSNGVPALSVKAGAPAAAGGGFVTPITLRNDSNATAAAVQVIGLLERDGRPVETRRAQFDYAPGKGEVRGGLVFQNDPAAYALRLSVEGYQQP